MSLKRRGRPVGSNRIFTDESLEGLQDFIDTHPESTLKNMQDYLSTNFNISPDMSTISKILKVMKITNKTIVRVPADRNTPELAQKRIEWSMTWILG